MKTATVGQLMIDAVLPEDMRGQKRTLDKKGLRELMQEVAEKHPEDYREVAHNLSRIGARVAYTSGGNSFGLKHMRSTASAQRRRKQLRNQINQLLNDDKLTDDQRDEMILKVTGRHSATQQEEIYQDSLAENNPLALQVLSGSRGNPMNLASLRGMDLLYTDHRGRAMAVPITSSYSQGLSPLEYWAGAYGARKGVMDTKFATQDAGFLSKQLNQIVHRAMITGLDDEDEPQTLRGLPVDVSDDESEGALLASPVAGYKRNTVLTPKILQSLRARKIKRILVRSPAVGGPGDGGIYARDAGIREFGRLPESGENVGMTAAQAMSEPLSQAQLSSKHSGGVAGASANQAVSGFDWINQLVQTPKHFKGGAAHAETDGLVQRIEDAPAGGQYVWIENKRHYVGKGFDLKVKRGDHIEAGDVISDGAPNPSTVVMYKGIGEGRRYFIKAFRQAFRDAGIKGHRRNIELLAKGLINHVRLTDEVGDYVPDDVVSYQQLERSWKPRPGSQMLAPNNAVGRYLERPYLHYSIGTKIRPSMLQDFRDFGVAEIETHEEEPPFQPEMIRGMANLQHDPDWITRMFGTGLKKGLLQGVHRGATSDPTGTSFVPGLARGVDFGRIGQVKTPTIPKMGMDKSAQPPVNQPGWRYDPKAVQEPEIAGATRAMELMNGEPEIAGPTSAARDREAKIAALQHMVKRMHLRQQYLDTAWKQYLRENNLGDRPLGDKLVDAGHALKWWLPGTWPLMFTSGGGDPTVSHYGYLGDQQGNELPGPFVNWYKSGRGIRNTRENNPGWEDYRYVNLWGGEDAPDMSPLAMAEGENFPVIGEPAKHKGTMWTSDGMSVVPNMTAEERRNWGKYFTGRYVRPDNPGDWLKPQYSPSARQIDMTLQKMYGEDWAEAKRRYWNPDRVWKSMRPEERVALVKQYYGEHYKGQEPTASDRDLGADTPPEQYKQFFPDHYTGFEPSKPLAYDPKLFDTWRQKYWQDKAWRAKHEAMNDRAKKAYMLAQANIAFGLQSGRLTPEEAQLRYRRLHDVAMAAKPDEAAYHMNYYNQDYPQVPQGYKPYDFGKYQPQNKGEGRNAPLLVNQYRRLMQADPTYKARLERLPRNAQVALMKAMAVTSWQLENKEITPEEARTRVSQLGGIVFHALPDQAAEAISNYRQIADSSLPAPLGQDIPAFTPGTPYTPEGPKRYPDGRLWDIADFPYGEWEEVAPGMRRRTTPYAHKNHPEVGKQPPVETEIYDQAAYDAYQKKLFEGVPLDQNLAPPASEQPPVQPSRATMVQQEQERRQQQQQPPIAEIVPGEQGPAHPGPDLLDQVAEGQPGPMHPAPPEGMYPRQPMPQQPAQPAPPQVAQPAQPQPAPPQPAPQPAPQPTHTVPIAGEPGYDQAVADMAGVQPSNRQGFTRQTNPWGLQLAGFAPQAVSSTIQNMGPAGIGAYGLLFNPSAVMTLAAGPGGSRPGKALKNPALSDVFSGMKQPPKSPSNPMTAPTMKSTTMVPG